MVVEGRRVSRDLAAYLEGGVEVAVKDDREHSLDKQVAWLARLREWNYNRWALDRIEKAEQSGGTALLKPRSLVTIDESHLRNDVVLVAVMHFHK